MLIKGLIFCKYQAFYSILNIKTSQYHLHRLAPVLKTIVHQFVISYTCRQSNFDGSVLKQSHQSKTGYKYMI